jgi:hypothetical protein
MALVTDPLTIPPAGTLNGVGQGAAARQLAAAASRAVVPLVYGEDRIGGLVLNVLAAAGTPGTLLVQVLWCHACDSINDMRLGDEALPAGVTATHYTGAQTVEDATLVAAFAAQGISGVRPLTGYAWSLITMPAALFNGTLNFTARIRGRRCYDPEFDTTAGGAGPQRLADPATWAYSEVPAVCLGDFLASPVYGCGVNVDWASVKLTGAANRAIVPGSSEPRRVIGVAFTTASAATDVAETLRAYAGCFLLPGPAGVRLLADANDAPVATYRHSLGDIAAIDPLELRDLGLAPTAVEVIYTDTSAIPWRDASALALVAGAGVTKPWRLSQVRLPGIHRHSQAQREADERLNKLLLHDVTTSMEVFDIGIRHDEGDIVTVEHPIGLDMVAMRVTHVTTPSPGRWRLDLVRHSGEAYSDGVVTVAPTVDGSRLLPIAPPSDVAGLAGVVSKGIITWTWTPPAERYYLETRLRLNGADWASATPLWAGRGSSLIQTVGAAGTYVLRARHAVIDGQESGGVATATVIVTAADLDASALDPTPPPQPDDPTLSAGFATVLVEQAPPAYTVGHGHGTTRLYGKAYTSGALPEFADAEVLAEFAGIAYAHSCGLGKTLRLWITWVTKDGVESLTPAGGTNGFAVTTGKVGHSDLAPLIVEADNIADGTITTGKLLSGLEPVTVFTGGSLPVTKSTSAIWFGNKLYRWDGAAYTAAVPTGDLSGTISDAQIAGLAAAKVSGTLTDAQLQAISAAKITGQLTNTQIADLAAGKITGTLIDAQIAAVAAAKLTGQITATQITDGAISTPKLAAGAVTANEIAAGSVTTAKLAAGAVTANEIAADTITAAQIAASAITATELAAGAVVAGKIAAGSIQAGDIAAGAITGDRLAANTVTASQIAANTVTAGQIAAGAITATELAADSVTAGKIQAGAIAVGSAAIADGAIRTALIENAAIDTAKIADGAIATAKIGDAAITAAKIADAQITTAKIADAQITAAKIVDATITTAKIADAQITTAKIGDAQVTSAKVGVLSANNLTVGAISDTVNGGASSGARVDIAANLIRVYDSSGVLRVRIGVW